MPNAKLATATYRKEMKKETMSLDCLTFFRKTTQGLELTECLPGLKS